MKFAYKLKDPDFLKDPRYRVYRIHDGRRVITVVTCDKGCGLWYYGASVFRRERDSEHFDKRALRVTALRRLERYPVLLGMPDAELREEAVALHKEDLAKFTRRAEQLARKGKAATEAAPVFNERRYIQAAIMARLRKAVLMFGVCDKKPFEDMPELEHAPLEEKAEAPAPADSEPVSDSDSLSDAESDPDSLPDLVPDDGLEGHLSLPLPPMPLQYYLA